MCGEQTVYPRRVYLRRMYILSVTWHVAGGFGGGPMGGGRGGGGGPGPGRGGPGGGGGPKMPPNMPGPPMGGRPPGPPGLSSFPSCLLASLGAALQASSARQASCALPLCKTHVQDKCASQRAHMASS